MSIAQAVLLSLLSLMVTPIFAETLHVGWSQEVVASMCAQAEIPDRMNQSGTATFGTLRDIMFRTTRH